MSNKIYALLVGINDYPQEVGKLSGCLNDVDHFNEYLQDSYNRESLAIEVLKDNDATRDNIIRQFRNHLGMAREGDVALFQYCGHGARWASAGAFKEFYPDGKDEGLVCIDSRGPGGYDLADKELAVLIAEVAKNNPHLAVILDCCHSGSGTRAIQNAPKLKARLTHEVIAERPLESYLDGYYATQQELYVPNSKHVLLAACKRTQLAQEDEVDQSGIFTTTLLEVLNKSGGDLSYAELFVQCRAAVRSRALNQEPQFEAYKHFNSYSGFLGRTVSSPGPRYVVRYDRGSWKVECGAIHGIPTEPEKAVTLDLYPQDDKSRLAGTASTTQVGAQESEVELDFSGDESTRYRAEITSMPVPPMPVYFKGDAGQNAGLQTALDDDGSVNVELTDIEAAARYAFSVKDGYLQLQRLEDGVLVQRTEIVDNKLGLTAPQLLPFLKHIKQWEHGLALQNPGTKMDSTLVDFRFVPQSGTTENVPEKDHEIFLDYVKDENGWKNIYGKIKACNRTGQPLHMLLAYYSSAFGVYVLKNDPIVPGEDFVTLWGDGPDDYFHLEDGDDESRDFFKLIVSTEKVDDFLLALDDIELGGTPATTRAIGKSKKMNKMRHRNEWFTKDLCVRLIRRSD